LQRVRFSTVSGRRFAITACPLMTRSGPWQPPRMGRQCCGLFDHLVRELVLYLHYSPNRLGPPFKNLNLHFSPRPARGGSAGVFRSSNRGVSRRRLARGAKSAFAAFRRGTQPRSATNPVLRGYRRVQILAGKQVRSLNIPELIGGLPLVNYECPSGRTVR